jgi:hypothetical protein
VVWLLVVIALLVLKFLVLLHKATQSKGKQRTMNTAISNRTAKKIFLQRL